MRRTQGKRGTLLLRLVVVAFLAAGQSCFILLLTLRAWGGEKTNPVTLVHKAMDTAEAVAVNTEALMISAVAKGENDVFAVVGGTHL